MIRARWRAGLFGFYDRIAGMPDSGLAISVRGLLIWAAVLAAAGYAAAATALYWGVWRNRPYNELTYADALFYPVRRAEILEKKGRAFIAQGQALYRESKYRDAMNLLRLGLARAPGDFEARRSLATLYLMANERTLAVRVLQEGLRDIYPGRAALEVFFGEATAAEDFAAVADVCARYRAKAPEADKRWLMEHEFAALSRVGRHQEALRVAENAGDGPLARQSRIVALLALGRSAEALTLLENWAHAEGAKVDQSIPRLRVRAAREAGRFEEMERMLRELRAAAPADPAMLVFGVVQWSLAGKPEKARATFEEFLFRFGGEVQNHVMMAQGLGEVSDVALLERSVAAARERGYPLERFARGLLEAQLARGDHEAAERTLALIPKSAAPGVDLWRTWVERMIESGRREADGAGVALVDYMRQRAWPADLFKKTVTALRAMGRERIAQEVLDLGARAFPASAWFRAEMEKIGASRAAL